MSNNVRLILCVVRLFLKYKNIVTFYQNTSVLIKKNAKPLKFLSIYSYKYSFSKSGVALENILCVVRSFLKYKIIINLSV